MFPWMVFKCVLPIRRQITGQFPALGFRETGADTDVVESARVIEKTQQQGSQGGLVPVLVPSKTRNDAITIPLVFHLEHDSLVRLVNTGHRFRDDTIETGAFETVEPI